MAIIVMAYLAFHTNAGAPPARESPFLDLYFQQPDYEYFMETDLQNRFSVIKVFNYNKKTEKTGAMFQEIRFSWKDTKILRVDTPGDAYPTFFISRIYPDDYIEIETFGDQKPKMESVKKIIFHELPFPQRFSIRTTLSTKNSRIWQHLASIYNGRQYEETFAWKRYRTKYHF